MSRQIINNKLAGETCFVNPPFDFISRLAVGETILSQSVTASVWSGVDPSPSALISGVASVINGTQVQQLLTAGVLGVIYELLCKVTTSLGQNLEISAYLAIIPELP